MHSMVENTLKIKTNKLKYVKILFKPFARPSKQQTCNSLLDIFTSIDKWSNTLCYCLKSIRSARKSVELFLFKRIQRHSRAAARAFCINLNANHTEVRLSDTNTYAITILRKKMEDKQEDLDVAASYFQLS